MKKLSLNWPISLSLLVSVLIGAALANPSYNTSTPKTAEIPLEHLDHVGINVTDLQKSADWYKQALGFDIFHKWNTTWMIRRGDMRIGLFLRPNATTIGDTDNKMVITHFAFVTDAEGFVVAQNRLKELGIKFEPPEDTGVAHSIFISDPDGYQVEITTYYK